MVSYEERLQAALAEVDAQVLEEATKRKDKLMQEHADRLMAPEYDGPTWVMRTAFDGAVRFRYSVRSAAECLEIMQSWRDKYGVFLDVGMYKTRPTVITAHPWGEYTVPEALKKSCPDGVAVRSSVGRGFASQEFTFFPPVPGGNVCVGIEVASTCSLCGFRGYVYCNYTAAGDPIDIQKRPPESFHHAAFTALFGSGARDSADFRAVFTFEEFKKQLLKANHVEGLS